MTLSHTERMRRLALGRKDTCPGVSRYHVEGYALPYYTRKAITVVVTTRAELASAIREMGIDEVTHINCGTEVAL